MKTQLIVCAVLILSVLASPAYAGCGKWVIRDNTDYLEDPMFDDAVASSTGSSATANADGATIVNNETDEKSQKASTNNTAAVVNEA
ncbi:MAG: lipoprotein, partial [Methanosaeta sp. ASP1-2]